MMSLSDPTEQNLSWHIEKAVAGKGEGASVKTLPFL